MAQKRKAQYLSYYGWAGALGLFFGLTLFVHALLKMANIQLWWFNDLVWNIWLSAFPWISATLSGAVLGLITGAICGIVCGLLLTWFHNISVDLFSK